MADKALILSGSSRADLSALPDDARRQLGFDLREVQHSRVPRDWKPMPTVGAGVVDIRLREADGAFRLFYVDKFVEAVYVLHAFQKKSQKTSALDLELARSRYAAVRRHQQEK